MLFISNHVLLLLFPCYTLILLVDFSLIVIVLQPEEGEREAGETDEQFEERVLNRRAAQLFAAMRPKLAAGNELAFNDLAPRHNNRKQVRLYNHILESCG